MATKPPTRHENHTNPVPQHFFGSCFCLCFIEHLGIWYNMVKPRFSWCSPAQLARSLTAGSYPRVIHNFYKPTWSQKGPPLRKTSVMVGNGRLSQQFLGIWWDLSWVNMGSTSISGVAPGLVYAMIQTSQVTNVKLLLSNEFGTPHPRLIFRERYQPFVDGFFFSCEFTGGWNPWVFPVILLYVYPMGSCNFRELPLTSSLAFKNGRCFPQTRKHMRFCDGLYICV